MRWALLLLPWLLFAGTNDGSIMLFNDSPFILTATIQASDGTYLGQYTVQPGQQSKVTQNLSNTKYTHPGTPPVSLTPYIVMWQCSSDDIYSMCTNVAPGSLVRANDCEGYRICRPKQGQKPAPPASKIK